MLTTQPQRYGLRAGSWVRVGPDPVVVKRRGDAGGQPRQSVVVLVQARSPTSRQIRMSAVDSARVRGDA